MFVQVLEYLIIAVVASGTVLLGTFVGFIGDPSIKLNSVSPLLHNVEPNQTQELTCAQALAFPIMSSITLVTLFFFFDYIQYILLIMLVAGAATSLFQLLEIWFVLKIQSQCSALMQRLFPYLNGLVTAIVIFEWARSGNAICHNILGCALSVVFISTIQFPSLKIAALCMSLLLVYDLFWVFFSEYFFSDNVMVAVATKQASNPVHNVASYLNLGLSFTSHMELPIKLIFPSSTGRMMMLGLGDIALPGALVALARKFDYLIAEDRAQRHKDCEAVEDGLVAASHAAIPAVFCNSTEQPIFSWAMTGYFGSLCFAFLANAWSGHPQPALIYLVPGVLLPMILQTYRLGKLADAWNGRIKSSFSHL